MSARGKILSVNISEQRGTAKRPVGEALLKQGGLEGDAHEHTPLREVSMLSKESIERFEKALGRQIQPGEFAENLTISGIEVSTVRPLDRFYIGGAELEVTQIGKSCHGQGCAIFRQVGRCIMPDEGIFCRVLREGQVKAGDELVHEPKRFRFHVITLSDRASKGIYEDTSGPLIRQRLERFASERGRAAEIDVALIPDDATKLRDLLEAARSACADAVFTTGGTGVGPRDSTPEVVSAFCDKLLPGIPEAIRTKYGTENPAARLSRSVAGVSGKMQLYALPGSPRAVGEYMEEILKTFEHVMYALHGLDIHG